MKIEDRVCYEESLILCSTQFTEESRSPYTKRVWVSIMSKQKESKKAWQIGVRPWGASNVWVLLAQYTYVYSWYKWLYYWRIDMRTRGSEISFEEKENDQSFSCSSWWDARNNNQEVGQDKTLEDFSNRHMLGCGVNPQYLVLLGQSKTSCIILSFSLCRCIILTECSRFAIVHCCH